MHTKHQLTLDPNPASRFCNATSEYKPRPQSKKGPDPPQRLKQAPSPGRIKAESKHHNHWRQSSLLIHCLSILCVREVGHIVSRPGGAGAVSGFKRPCLPAGQFQDAVYPVTYPFRQHRNNHLISNATQRQKEAGIARSLQFFDCGRSLQLGIVFKGLWLRRLLVV